MWTGVLLGCMGALSADSWPVLWLILEVNLMSFLTQLAKKWSMKTQTILYFIVQRVGTIVILSGGLMSDRTAMIGHWVILGLLLKSRLAPFHFWGAVLVSKMTSGVAYIFITWQKIVPIIILFQLNIRMGFLFLNIMIASMCSVGTKNIHTIMFFSGLLHICWVLTSPVTIAYQYFFLYSLILLPIFTYGFNPILILNLAGLPPITGFFMKLMVLQTLRIRFCVILFLFSVPLLFVYLRAFMWNTGAREIKMSSLLVCRIGLFRFWYEKRLRSTFNWNSISIAPCFQR